jgi:Tfp pilus assembly protein PilO
MLKSFRLRQFRDNLMRDPRLVARVVIGTLLAANLAAAWMVFRPVGGTAEELDAQVVSTRQQILRKQLGIARLRTLTGKMKQAKSEGENFMSAYFLNGRTKSSTILAELFKSAKEAGIKPKGDSFAFEPIEGSDTLSMLTINANFEGTYDNLLQFVNRLDKSPRFLILENLKAEPLQAAGNQQATNMLSVQIKLYAFVREDAIQQ